MSRLRDARNWHSGCTAKGQHKRASLDRQYFCSLHTLPSQLPHTPHSTCCCAVQLKIPVVCARRGAVEGGWEAAASTQLVCSCKLLPDSDLPPWNHGNTQLTWQIQASDLQMQAPLQVCSSGSVDAAQPPGQGLRFWRAGGEADGGGGEAAVAELWRTPSNPHPEGDRLPPCSVDE